MTKSKALWRLYIKQVLQFKKFSRCLSHMILHYILCLRNLFRSRSTIYTVQVLSNILFCNYLPTGCPGSNIPIWKSFYSETMHVRPQLSKAKIGLTMKQFFCTFHLFLTNRHKTNKLDPIFQSSFRGLVDRRLECYAIGPGFESYSGH